MKIPEQVNPDQEGVLKWSFIRSKTKSQFSSFIFLELEFDLNQNTKSS